MTRGDRNLLTCPVHWLRNEPALRKRSTKDLVQPRFFLSSWDLGPGSAGELSGSRAQTQKQKLFPKPQPNERSTKWCRPNSHPHRRHNRHPELGSGALDFDIHTAYK